jgi:carbamoyltransferase
MSRLLLQYHPTIGYHFIPGIKTRVEHEGGGYLLRVNQAGFRCAHEFVPQKRPGTFRILLFGDSYTAGHGVSDPYRYGDVLERLVPGLEVYNFGLQGTGTDQQYLIFREKAAGIDYDLIVISVFVENIRRVVARYRPWVTNTGEMLVFPKPYFALAADGSLHLRNVPVSREPVRPEDLPRGEWKHFDYSGKWPRVRATVNRMGPRVKDLVQRLTHYQPLPEYTRSACPAAWQLMKRILGQWIAETTAPVLICPIPLYQHIEETASPAAYLARFHELHDPPRVIVHDVLPAFHRVPRSERRRLRFTQDPHLTPVGHYTLAESLAGCIRPVIERAASRRDDNGLSGFESAFSTPDNPFNPCNPS